MKSLKIEKLVIEHIEKRFHGVTFSHKELWLINGKHETFHFRVTGRRVTADFWTEWAIVEFVRNYFGYFQPIKLF
jgi:hypothetical protein